MDKDVLFRALMAAVLAVLIWNLLIQATNPPPPAQPQAAVEQPATADTNLAKPLPEGITLDRADARSELEIGNIGDGADGAYPLSLALTTRGASIARASLRDFAAVLKGEQRYVLNAAVEIGEQSFYSMSTESVTVNGAEIPLNTVDWQLVSGQSGDRQVVFQVVVNKDGLPQLRLTKTYVLNDVQPSEHHGSLDVRFGLHNLSDGQLEVILTQWGPLGVPKEDLRQDLRRVTAGLRGEIEVQAEYKGHGDLEAEFQPLFTDPAASLEWVAVANKYFAVIVAPLADDSDDWVADTKVANIGANVEAGGEPVDGDTFRLVTKPLSLAPQAQLEKRLECYFGAKSKQLFTENADYSERQYVALVNADYYMCAWTWVVNMMLWLLGTVHGIWPHNYGVAIIVMVLVVRTLLHPLTKQSQVGMMRMAERMGKLQPKMEELKEKYKNDKQKLNQEMMKLYQVEGVNPAGQMLSCLPMMCQLPIWAGLWASLSYTVEMRHQPFFLWIHDLTAPDHCFSFGREIPLVGEYFNLLPILLGLFMFLQQHFMPKPAAAATKNSKTPDQMAQQRMMMTIMSVMMVVFFYAAPSGLTLYIMASSVFGLVEQYFIRKHIKQEKEQAKQPGSKDPKTSNFKKPRFLQKLERLAEEAKKS